MCLSLYWAYTIHQYYTCILYFLITLNFLHLFIQFANIVEMNLFLLTWYAKMKSLKWKREGERESKKTSLKFWIKYTLVRSKHTMNRMIWCLKTCSLTWFSLSLSHGWFSIKDLAVANILMSFRLRIDWIETVFVLWHSRILKIRTNFFK